MSKTNLRIISKSIYKVYGGGGRGYVKNINRTNNADSSFFSFFFEIEIHSADKIYVFVGGNV